MPENDQPGNNPNETKAKDKHSFKSYALLQVLPIGLRRILLAGGILFTTLVSASIFAPHMKERLKFFTENFLSLVVLIAILVQAYINRRQWEAMDRQSDAMQGQLDAMRATLAQNERAVIAAEQNVQIAKENAEDARWDMWQQQGATTQQYLAMEQQTSLMRRQLKVMQETLADNRRVYDMTERPMIVVESARILNFAPNTPLIPAITIANRGRAHATNLRLKLLMYADEGWDYTQGFPECVAHVSYIGFLAAGDKEEIHGHMADGVAVDVKLYNLIKNGNAFLMIYGDGEYQDLTGERKYLLKDYIFHYYSDTNKIVRSHYAEAWMEQHKEQAAAEQENPKQEGAE